MTNYRFKEQFRTVKVAITVGDQRYLIIQDNLTDTYAELILERPHFAHLVELKPGAVPFKKKEESDSLNLEDASALTLTEAQTDGKPLKKKKSQKQK